MFSNNSIEQLAAHGSVPVINALCDVYHPCQALADFVTLAENFDDISTIKLAYVGDANNVSNSLMIMAAIVGVDFTLVCPEGHGPDESLLNKAIKFSEISGSKLLFSSNISALGQQDAIYTDTWISMGSNTNVDDILATFKPYQVNHELMAKAGASIVMHCQPAHLEEEITTELFDSEMSVAFQSAENRMWAQNAVLVTLLAD